MRGGQFAQGLERSRGAALALYERLRADRRFLTPFPPELDIVLWIPVAASVSASSDISRAIFDKAAERDLHLALAEMPVDFFDTAAAGIIRDRETVTCLRSALMKAEHLDWVGAIWDILEGATGEVLSRRGQ